MRDKLEKLADRYLLRSAEASNDGRYTEADAWKLAASELRTLSQQQGGAGVPDGFALAPRRPTDAMIEAGCDANTDKAKWPGDFGDVAKRIRRKNMRAAWCAMLAAAPQPDHSAGVGGMVINDVMVERLAKHLCREEWKDRCPTMEQMSAQLLHVRRYHDEARAMLRAALAQPAATAEGEG